jgi:hypothetical protein
MKNSAQIKQQLREASEAEIASRIREHQLSVDRIKAGMEHRRRLGLAPRPLQLDFLAIGDSWFEYPLGDYGLPVPFSNFAIVGPRHLPSMGTPPPLINSIALHSQPMTAIMGLGNQERMKNLLGNPDGWLSATGLPDAILVSGGGDDIAGDQFILYLDALGGTLSAGFQAVLDLIEWTYTALFKFRDEFAPNVPIFGHCYDYALPNGHGVLFAQRGWLRPSLDFAGYSYADDLVIVADAIDRFYQMLHALAGQPANLFTLVDTRGTLTRDTSHPLGWANELHPYTTGFSALAQKFLTALQHHHQFLGRI